MEEKYPKLEVESNGYMKSFTIKEKDAYKTFFDTYGFVVISNVITPAECSTSCDEVWDSLEEKEATIDREDPLTWSEQYWPKDICRRGGFINKFPYWKRMSRPALKETFVAKQIQAWKNRENPIIYKIFRHLLSSRRLWGSIDRYGIMRPSNFHQMQQQQQAEIGTDGENDKVNSNANANENWATKSQWLHWDLSPFHYGTSAAGFAPKKKIDYASLNNDYGGVRVQGLIALTDGPVTNGGFHCVPGFQHQFFRWRDDNINEYGSRPDVKKRNFIEVPEDDEMREHICQVPMRRGSLLIWNSMVSICKYVRIYICIYLYIYTCI